MCRKAVGVKLHLAVSSSSEIDRTAHVRSGARHAGRTRLPLVPGVRPFSFSALPVFLVRKQFQRVFIHAKPSRDAAVARFPPLEGIDQPPARVVGVGFLGEVIQEHRREELIFVHAPGLASPGRGPRSRAIRGIPSGNRKNGPLLANTLYVASMLVAAPSRSSFPTGIPRATRSWRPPPGRSVTSEGGPASGPRQAPGCVRDFA